MTEPNRYGKTIESLYSQLLASEAEADAAEASRDEWKLKWRDAINHADRIAAEDAALRAELEEAQAHAAWYAAEAKWWEWGEFCNRREARHLDADYGLIIDRVLEWADDYAEAFDRPEVPALLRQIIDGNGC